MSATRKHAKVGWALVAAGLLTGGLAACSSDDADDATVVGRASLIDDTGRSVGTATFTRNGDGPIVGRVALTLPTDSPEFHGLHLHANADRTGCQTGTGFTAVGGHWDTGGHAHGSHTGDLPSVTRRADGEGEAVFTVDKFKAADIVGKAVIVHAGPDNFANVPRGTEPNTYTDNGEAYDGAGGTAATGNAGARYACGVIAAAS
ncbi:superoxide dismutase family protein [Sporichthya sp.]|uniref:superoxide dismutase family protein n=1 Tax=Sporichthya sp. TaxID=65475 RepID=UPI0017E0C96C|nr:superoxide dismutase family protein [Sporichthya sp.]MBA3745550.1 superoxide dismutase family protein [Sporichthya sp.]